MRPKCVITLGIQTDAVKDVRNLHGLAEELRDAINEKLSLPGYREWAITIDYNLRASTKKAMAANFKKRGIRVIEKDENGEATGKV